MPDIFNRPTGPTGPNQRPVANPRTPTLSGRSTPPLVVSHSQPDFDLMWKNFPDRKSHPKLIHLHTHIGGALENNIHTPGFGPTGNTCAVRISRALNYGGSPISRQLTDRLKISTLTGGDRRLYIFRVREMKTYLSAAFGPASKTATSDFMNAFKGSRGIVSFDVQGWSDASGHIALWNGSSFRESSDDYRGLKDDPATSMIEATTTRMS